MIQSKTQSILKNYIVNTATKNNVAISDITLLVKFDEKLNYYECLNYIPQKEVTFSSILGMIDILGIEKKAKKFMIDSLGYFAKKHVSEIENTMVYIKVINDEVCLVCYCDRIYKETTTLLNHFEHVKIE